MRKYIILVLVFNIGFSIAQNTPGEYAIKNLAINTEFADFGTSFFGNDAVVFSSPRTKKSIIRNVWKPNQQQYLDLYIGSINSNGEIINKRKMLGTINSKFHEAEVAFTNDLKTVYFTGNNFYKNKVYNDSSGVLKLQLFKASVGVDGGWTNIVKLPFNNDQYSTGHPALSTDEKQLYFVSDRPGSIGKSDIYVVAINADGTYGEPKNLGSKINTDKREMFPFMSKDGILYFSSEGHTSMGGLDVFASKLFATTFTAPVNLGSPINSVKDDFAYIINVENNKGYFSSNRKNGNGDDDIYGFETLEPIAIQCMQLMSGTIRNTDSQEGISDALIKLIDSNGAELQTVNTDDDGAFSFKIGCGNSYKIVGSKENYGMDEQIFSTVDGLSEEITTVDLNLKPEIVEFVETRIETNPIHFDLNKWNIRPDAAIELEKVVKIMKDNPNIIVESRSHTDARGIDSYNLVLSDKRAKSTVAYIVSKGISADRISGKGYGETKLLNECSNTKDVKCNKDQHQENRRTEFFIVKKDN